MLLKSEKSILTIIDVQERLAPATNSPKKVIDGCKNLVKAANLLSIPVVVTEQYPKGLGPTIFDVREVVKKEDFIEKTTFSCAGTPSFITELEKTERKQIVIAGVEMHICVLQTALALKELGYDVFVVTDACSSRKIESEEAAKTRMANSGIHCITVEMALFEWLAKAGTKEFKEISSFIK